MFIIVKIVVNCVFFGPRHSLVEGILPDLLLEDLLLLVGEKRLPVLDPLVLLPSLVLGPPGHGQVRGGGMSPLLLLCVFVLVFVVDVDRGDLDEAGSPFSSLRSSGGGGGFNRSLAFAHHGGLGHDILLDRSGGRRRGARVAGLCGSDFGFVDGHGIRGFGRGLLKRFQWQEARGKGWLGVQIVAVVAIVVHRDKGTVSDGRLAFLMVDLSGSLSEQVSNAGYQGW